MALKTLAGANGGRRGEAGFTLLQIAITVAIVAIVTSFGVMQIAIARDRMTLTSAANEFAGYTEKARLDSIRRHGDGTVSPPASVTFESNAGYTANYDRDQDGALETSDESDFDLPEGVTVSNVAITTGSTTVNRTPTAANPVTISFDWRGRTASAYRITFTNPRGHQSVVGITAAGEVSVDRLAITLSPGTYGNFNGDAGSLGPNGTSAGNTNTNSSNTNSNSSNTNSNSSNTNSNSSNTNTNTSNSNSNSSNTNSNSSNTNSNSSNTNSNSSNTNSNSSNGNSNSSNGNSNSTPGSAQCSMSISPATTQDSAYVLHNGDGPTSTTFTVTFTNPPVSGASFTLDQIPNKLEVAKTGATTIKVTSKTGNGNKGNYSFLVKPSTGCGANQKVYVNVVN